MRKGTILATIVRRSGETAGKGLALTRFYFPIGPRMAALLVENYGPYYRNLAGVSVLFLGVGLAHRTETKGRYGLGALTKALQCQRAIRRNHAPAFASG